MRQINGRRLWRMLGYGAVLCTIAFMLTLQMGVAEADSTYHNLCVSDFSQDWTDTSLITANDDWSGVPSIIGYLGARNGSTTGVNPETILEDLSDEIDVIANQTNTNITNGGVTEFHIANPVVALQGSAAADAPHIVIYLDTTGTSEVTVSYNIRDIDGSADNAIQPVAAQYRVGNIGNYTNIPAAFVADATTGGEATLVTPVSFTLPIAALNQPEVQIRIMTTNADGSDEWVAVRFLHRRLPAQHPPMARQGFQS
jgi:hypothetical protein